MLSFSRQKKESSTSSPSENTGKENSETDRQSNRGKLILDATCAPSDIKYPQDIGLLNAARKQTEKLIDLLYQPLRGQLKQKPRTYRQKARKDYLVLAKQRKPSSEKRRQGIKKQLQYIRRNLSHIEKLINQGSSLIY